MTSESLSRHPYFTPWIDPQSGAESFILTQRVAPVQQTFYFNTPSVSADGKWLWFYTAFPPGNYRTLGVVSLDPDRPLIRHFPQMNFLHEAPMVTPEGDAVYNCVGTSVWRQPIEGAPTLVCSLDDQWIAKRSTGRLATHLTLSADGKYLLLDGFIGGHWFVGIADVRTGEVRIIKDFLRHMNHAQFSPVDPNLFLIAEDWLHEPTTGQWFEIDHRTWLMDIHRTRFEPLCPTLWSGTGVQVAHEWWSKDGKVCWVDYAAGVFECDPVVGAQPFNVWPGPLCHAHCDSKRRMWCGDESPYKWPNKPCEVKLFDRETQKQRHIVTAMPPPPYARGLYHIDPHPQFTPDDTFIAYTTMVRGMVDVALSPVASTITNGLR